MSTKQRYLQDNSELIKTKILKGRTITEIADSLDVGRPTLVIFLRQFPDLELVAKESGNKVYQRTKNSYRTKIKLADVHA